MLLASFYHSYDASGRGNTCLYPPSPMRHALVQGAVSGLLAAGCIAAALWWAGSSNEILLQILDERITGFVLLGVFFLGIIICQISAFFVVNKLVAISKDDLYY